MNLPSSGMPTLPKSLNKQQQQALAKVMAKQKRVREEAKKQQLANMKAAAKVLSFIKRDNPKMNLVNEIYNQKKFNWKETYINKDEAATIMVEAIARLKANVVPRGVKKPKAIAIALLEAGINSAVELVNNYSPSAFISKFKNSFKSAGGLPYVEQAYNNALEARSRILMHYMNLSDLSQSHYAVTPWSISQETINETTGHLANFVGLFGREFYMDINHDNSVLSPAAYLYELRKTLTHYLKIPAKATTAFDKRRPDIADLALTRNNTSSEVMKLEIVNKVLHNHLQALYKQKKVDVYAQLADATYPLSLPFNLPFERAREMLKLVGTDLTEIWQCFSASTKALDLANPNYWVSRGFYAKALPHKQLQNLCGLTPHAKTGFLQAPVGQVIDCLRLTYGDINAMISGNLCEAELTQEAKLAQLFINRDEDGIVSVADDKTAGQVLINLSDARVNKMIKLSKLARESALSISELQRILLCAAKLEGQKTSAGDFFARALPYVAAVSQCKADDGLDLEEALGLIGVLRTAGQAQGVAAIDTIFPDLYGKTWDPAASDSVNIKIRYALMSITNLTDYDFDELLTFIKRQFITAHVSAMGGDRFTSCDFAFCEGELPDSGKNFIYAKAVGDSFAIRMFDAKGQCSDYSNTVLPGFLNDQLKLLSCAESISDLAKTGVILNILSYLDRSPFLLDEEVLAAFYRMGKLLQVLSLNLGDTILLLQGLHYGDGIGASFAGPVQAPSNNLEILADVRQANRWLQQQSWNNNSLFCYVVSGQKGEDFGALSNDASASLVQAISTALSEHLVSDSVLNSAVQKAINDFAAVEPDGEIIDASGAELSYANLASQLQQLGVLSRVKFVGAVLRVPDHAEVIDFLSGQKIGATRGEVSVFYAIFARRVRQYLMYYRNLQLNAAQAAVQSYFQLDQGVAASLGHWGSYIFPSSNLLAIVAEETNRDRQRCYFNAYNRMKTLITTFALSADDLVELLRLPSIFQIDPNNGCSPLLELSTVQALSQWSSLKTQYSTSLYSFLKSGDIATVANDTGWSTNDLNILNKHWKLDDININTQAEILFRNDGATAISSSGNKMALGYAAYNEIAVLEKQGDHWQVSSVNVGISKGNLGVAVALHKDTLVGIDNINNKAPIYICDGDQWHCKNALSFSEKPLSITLNDKWCCVAFEKSIDIYSALDLNQSTVRAVASIASDENLCRVFLDSANSDSLVYVTTAKKLYSHNLTSASTTCLNDQLARAKLPLKTQGLTVAVAGGLLVTSDDANSLHILAPKDATQLFIATDYAQLSAGSMASYTLQYSDSKVKEGIAALDLSLADNCLYILTAEAIQQVSLLQSAILDFWPRGAKTLGRLNQCFALSARTSLPLSQLLHLSELASQPQYAAWQQAADRLTHSTKVRYSQSEWQQVFKPYNIAIEEKKRDVLVDALLWQFAHNKAFQHIQSHQDLAEYLLLDIDVSALVTTSYVKEAISALQLYIYRCQMNLETGVSIDPKFDSYWQWMRSYSTWQANRLIFLYPENYLEPELRKGRSPLFDEFNGYIQRNNANPNNIDSAYNIYLDGFLAISNLKLVNIWEHKESDNSQKLYMIGRTIGSDGYKYYFRRASMVFNSQLSAQVPDDWGVWQEIEAKIPCKWISPICAFGRLYVFWSEIQNYSGSDENKKGTSIITLKCCYFNFRGKWSLVQTIADGISSNECPKTAEDRQAKRYHRIMLDLKDSAIHLRYLDAGTQRERAYHIDPHMRVEQEAQTLPDYAFEDTNMPKVCMGIWDAYNTRLPHMPTPPITAKNIAEVKPPQMFVDIDCTLGEKTVAGWFATGDLKNDEHIFDVHSHVKSGKIGITAYASKQSGKLVISSSKTKGKNALTTAYNLNPQSWYYIGFALLSTKVKGYYAHKITDVRIAEAEGVSGTEVFGKLTKLHCNLTATLDKNLNLTKPKMVIPPMPIPGMSLAALQEKVKSQVDSMTTEVNQTTVLFYPALLRNIVIFNSAKRLDPAMEMSGITFQDKPVVHLGRANELECSKVNSSGKSQLALVETQKESYLAVNSHDNQKQYFYRLNSSVGAQFDTLYSSSVDGVAELLSPKTQHTQEASFAALQPDPARVPEAFWPQDQFIDIYGADSVYYWELFFFVPMLIAKSYANKGECELAKKWYEIIFNPFDKGVANFADPNDRFWYFVGLQTQNNPTLRCEHFGEVSFELIEESAEGGSRQPKWDSHLPAVKRYHEDPFDPHAIAALRPIAYQRSVFKHYIDNLLNWGDSLYRQNTRETLEEAYMLYSMASDVLGKRPVDVGEKPAPAAETLAQLEHVNNNLSEFLVGIENTLTASGPINSSPINTPSNDIIHAYFEIPENTAFIELWDRLDNRLFNLRHQLTLDGKPNSLPLFQPPANPMQWVSAAATGSTGSWASTSTEVEVPPYRYSTMYSKAVSLVSYVMRFGSQLQSALRSNDMEVLNQLRAVQQVEIMKLMDEVKRSAIDVAQKQLDSANLSLSKTEYQRDYYDTLLNDGVGSKSADVRRFKAAIGLKDYGLYLTEYAAVMMTISADTDFLKMVLGPFSGLIFGFSDGGADTVASPEAASHSAGQLGFASQTQAGVAEKAAAQLEQAQNHFLRKKEMEHQIEETEKRIAVAETRLASSRKQYEIYRARLANSEQIERFYEKKFLNEELYTWLAQRLSSFYKKAYDMAHELALECQRCWQYEIGNDSISFIDGYYWNHQYRGFLAGEALEADLLRMDKAYYERNERTFEICKEISLAEVDPIAFLTLLQNGSCHFSLSEALFNQDYPGHIMRRIKSVSLSVQTQVSSSAKPSNINATLSQLSSQFYVEPDIDVVSFLQTGKTTAGEEELDAQQQLKLRNNFCNNQQIATSTADDDAGLFSVSFTYDYRYLPFEGTGAVSNWQLEIGHAENPKLCTNITSALAVTGFINELTMDQLLDFIRATHGSQHMANSFHSEVMERLKSHSSVDDLVLFVTTMVDDSSFSSWFNNMGQANLSLIVSALGKLNQAATATKLSNYIDANKTIPDAISDSNFTDSTVLNITDVTIKLSYTAKNGGDKFREKVRKLNVN